MDAPGNQMRRATAILGAQRLYYDPEPSFEQPQPPGTTASLRNSSPPEGGRLVGRVRAPVSLAGQASQVLTARWLAGWLAEIFCTQIRNPQGPAVPERPCEYEVPPHLGAARLGVSVTNKVTGMEGAFESFLSSPHTTLADYALVVTAI